MDSVTEKIAVIGGGAIGVFAAVALQREGREVVLIDRGGKRSAVLGSAGILASCAMIPAITPHIVRRLPSYLLRRDSPLYLRFRDAPRLARFFAAYLANARRYRETAAALAPLIADSPARHLAFAKNSAAAAFIKTGDYVYLYANDAEFAADAPSRELRVAHGISGEKMTRRDLADFDPHLSDALQAGWRMKNHGWLSDPPGYIAALTSHFSDSGGEIVTGAASSLIAEERGAAVALEDGRRIRAAIAVVACGAHSAKLLASIGGGAKKIPLAAERGYNVEFVGASFAPPCPYMIDAAKFVITPMAGRLRVAGLAEFSADADAPPQDAPGDFIVRRMRSIYPDLQFSQTRRWVGARPATPDSLPLIGALAGGRVICAFGHHHIGLTAAPATANIVADLVAGRDSPIPVAPFSPARFF